MEKISLSELQKKLLSAVRGDVNQIIDIIKSNSKAEAIARLKGYQISYQHKIINSLKSVCPAFLSFIKNNNLENILMHYIHQTHSDSYTIKYFTDTLPKYILNSNHHQKEQLYDILQFEYNLHDIKKHYVQLDKNDIPITNELFSNLNSKNSGSLFATRTNAPNYCHAFYNSTPTPKITRLKETKYWIVWPNKNKISYAEITKLTFLKLTNS